VLRKLRFDFASDVGLQDSFLKTAEFEAAKKMVSGIEEAQRQMASIVSG
jgi:hypothetical protein